MDEFASKQRKVSKERKAQNGWIENPKEGRMEDLDSGRGKEWER